MSNDSFSADGDYERGLPNNKRKHKTLLTVKYWSFVTEMLLQLCNYFEDSSLSPPEILLPLLDVVDLEHNCLLPIPQI